MLFKPRSPSIFFIGARKPWNASPLLKTDAECPWRFNFPFRNSYPFVLIRVSAFVLIMESSVTLAWRSGRACHSVRAVGLNPPAWVGNRGGQGTARPTRRCSKVNFNCYSVGPPACGRAGVSRPAENDSRQSSAPDAFGSALNRNLVVRINRQFRRISACPSNSSASVSSPRICSPSRQSSSRRYCLGNRQFARIPNHTTFC